MASGEEEHFSTKEVGKWVGVGPNENRKYAVVTHVHNRESPPNFKWVEESGTSEE